MCPLRPRFALPLLAALLAAAPAAAQIVILHTFTGGADGAAPTGDLLLSGSTMVGMTTIGGSGGGGTAFRINPDASNYAIVHNFVGLPNDGSNPNGALIQIGPTLYGLTETGGASNAGAAFQMSPAGAGFGLTHQFADGPTDGGAPYGSPVYAGGFVYGTTRYGGNVPNQNNLYQYGVVFRMNPDGSNYTVLHNFGGPGDGQAPTYTALVQIGNTLYGTTFGGGTSGGGTVYSINLDGSGYTVLHSFAGGTTDGRTPFGSLTVVEGILCGMTYSGGAHGGGTIFRLNPDGTSFTVMHSFAGGTADAAGPQGGLTQVGNTLYGMTTAGGADALGVLFGMNQDGSGYSVVHTFVGGANDGSQPVGEVIAVGSDLYGMTSAGGSSGDGVVFEFPISVPEPSTLLLVASASGAFAFYSRRLARRGPKRLHRWHDVPGELIGVFPTSPI